MPSSNFQFGHRPHSNERRQSMTPPSDITTWILLLTKCIRDEVPLDLALGQFVHLNESSTWPAGRKLPAAAVRAVLTNSAISIPPHGLAIRGALFDECLDFDDIKFDHRIHLSRCVLAGGLKARHAEFRELTLTEVDVAGGIHASGVIINGRLDLSGSHLVSRQKVALDLHNSTIAGSLLIKGSIDATGKVSRGFVADGTVRLDGASIGGHLAATTSVFVNPADLNQFRTVESGPCSLYFDGAHIGGDVVATNNFRAYGEVRGVTAKIGGKLNLSGAQIINTRRELEPGLAALTLNHADIRTDFVADKGFVAVGEVSAVGIKVGGRLDLTGADLRNPSTVNDHRRYALILDNARIALDVAAGVRTTGAVSATGMTVGGQLTLSGAVLDNPNTLGVLILDGAEICGDLWASEDHDHAGNKLAPLRATGEVRALRVSIGGDLNLEGAEIVNPEGDAITLDNAQIGRHVFASGFTANGTVRALGINIGHSLYLDGAQLSKSTCTTGAENASSGDNLDIDDRQFALLLDDAAIGGTMYASYSSDGKNRGPFVSVGTIRALGLTIGRDLNMAGAVLNCPSPASSASGVQYALQLDHAKIGGNFVGHPHTSTNGKILAKLNVTGPVRFVKATIGGDFDIEDARLLYEPSPADTDGYALDISGTRVTGSVNASQRSTENDEIESYAITGGIRARNLVVGVKFDLHGATVDGKQDSVLDLESARIAELRLTPKACTGGVSLVRAQIADLHAGGVNGAHNDCTACRLPPHPLRATGWEIDDLQGAVRDDWKLTHDWLQTAPPETHSMYPTTCWERITAGIGRKPSVAIQPWYVLAGVYERNGEPHSARKIRFAANQKVTAQSPIGTRFARSLYRGVVGYGLHPLWSVISMVGLVFLATFAVCMGSAHIIPTKPSQSATAIQQDTATLPPPITAQTPCEEHPDYPCMQPLAFAINAVLPPAAGTNTQWTVSSDAPLILVIVLTSIKLALWATAALFLAGVTGLLRTSKS
ncbi:hypothetical protein [Mycolicibacterium sp. P9-22]|uniref:hypothetical protein n=1 Tax=Mycolicibacterium sp. P9-22 TaxID=2024613 RepID=UPI0011EF982C|nr:hypothetical protein [Mycolicibacterium sp. P9-22]